MLVWAYTLMMLWLAWRSSRTEFQQSRRITLQIWIALLSLSSFRTPLAPSAYVVAPTLLLLMLLAPEVEGRKKFGFALAGAWLVIMGVPPLPAVPELIFDFVSQSLLIAINLWVLLRKPFPSKNMR